MTPAYPHTYKSPFWLFCPIGVTCCIATKQMTKVFLYNIEQISSELKQYYKVEGLEDVRVIRDRQTSECNAPISDEEITEAYASGK